MFYLDANSQVIQRVVTEGVPGPEHNLGAVLFPGSTVAAVWRPDGERLDLFGRGTESALWQKPFTWASGWGGWHGVTGTARYSPTPTAVSSRPPARRVLPTERQSAEQVPLLDGQRRSRSSRAGDC